MREKDNQREKHPLFKKTNDIIDLVTAILESLSEAALMRKEMLEFQKLLWRGQKSLISLSAKNM